MRLLIFSLYQLHGRVFSDGPSETSDFSSYWWTIPSTSIIIWALPAVARRRIAAPENKMTRSLSRHGGSKYTPRESVDHRANPPMDVVGAGISTSNLWELQAEVGRLQQRLQDLFDLTEQERQELLSLETWVQLIRLYRSDDRYQLALYQLENEQERQVFRDEVDDIRHHNAALHIQIENLARNRKNLLEVLERGGCIRPRKISRGDNTGGDDRHKT
uniref:RxLR effector candidate protein n=1 Tax=Hyaloperonospora arabidopsidis (strain Emoy2) TaxID=559515 RepID=M4BA78_HYAAE